MGAGTAMLWQASMTLLSCTACMLYSCSTATKHTKPSCTDSRNTTVQETQHLHYLAGQTAP